MDQRLKSTVDRKLKSTALAAMFALSLLGQAVPSGAQTKVTPPKNGFTPAQDVELGQKAAAEVRQQMPLVKKADVQQYIQQIGERLVSAISPELRQPAFRYSFQVVNASDINAFALPGGPMFVNRGMIAAAKNEGQVAGVMAHELSHVVLRHGTAQATKAQKYQFGELAGAIIGAVVGGTAGQVIAQGTQFGLGTAFLRFSREFERDADLEGSHIMARAGYDPRDMAAMFKTIEQQDKSRAPQWLSDHPNPGNRAEYITREARLLQVEGGRDSGQLQTMKAELERLPPAQTTEQIMRNAQRQQGGGANGESGGVGTSGALSPNVEPPSSSFKTYDVGNVFRVSVPANWRQLQGNTNSVTFAPEGGFGSAQGSSVFTHGVEMGIAVAQASGDLRAATDQLVQGLAQSNPGLQAEGNSQPVSFAGRQGLQVRLRNVSEATGKPEVVVLTTALLDDGNLFYSIGVAPQDEFGQYGRTLQRVNQSVQLEK